MTKTDAHKIPEKNENRRKIIMFSIIAVFVIVFDQITKHLIDTTMRLGERIEIIPNFLDIRYISNTGAAFGIMAKLPDGARLPFLIGVSILAMLLVFYLFVKAEGNRVAYQVSLALVFSGAVGNLIDRVWLGFVRDFVDAHIYDLHWPVFNVADSAITVGIVILAYELLIREPRLEREAERG
ncbi:MAG: signal peptidase II [Deltaproteobacteria bacterium]|nr:signal peptidase II [Candidatus Zymogenaceae bacterium]